MGRLVCCRVRRGVGYRGVPCDTAVSCRASGMSIVALRQSYRCSVSLRCFGAIRTRPLPVHAGWTVVLQTQAAVCTEVAVSSRSLDEAGVGVLGWLRRVYRALICAVELILRRLFPGVYRSMMGLYQILSYCAVVHCQRSSAMSV